MNKIAIYPGTFDPITHGHIDLIKRGIKTFDKLVVAVAHNPDKNPLFTVSERVDMLKEITKDMKNVKVDDFGGLLIDYVRIKGANVVLRGIRAFSDFEYEFQMALINRKLSPETETIFMMPNESFSYVSSKIIKQIASMNGDISKFVPEVVEEYLKKKLNS
ncbi:MAG: pantetheine-phosphate adenylyltransferase [bacterium]|nr:pantetheine-phosphate adenylyltransferase [bacterium]